METSRLVFGPLLCPSFIQIDEERKESQFRWLKKLSPSSHPDWACCFQTHSVIGITWQQQKISFIKQKVFQRPFSQANGYLINQTGKDSKCLQNNCIQHLQAHPKLLSWAFSLFSCIKAATIFLGSILVYFFFLFQTKHDGQWQRKLCINFSSPTTNK